MPPKGNKRKAADDSPSGAKRSRADDASSVDSTLQPSSTIPVLVVDPVPRTSSKVNFSKTKPGEWQSRVTYVKVVEKYPSSQKVQNEHGYEYTQSSDIPEHESHSCCQFDRTETVTRTQAVEILEGARDTCFTVEFYKQPTHKDIASKLLTFNLGEERFKTKGEFKQAKLNKFIKEEIMRGEKRTLVGYLLEMEPKMGRSQVIDLDIPISEHRERQVDHRSIVSIIIRNVKYIVK